MDRVNVESKAENNNHLARPVAVILSALLSMPLFVACGSQRSNASLAPIDDSRNVNAPLNNNRQQARPGMSTGQKVAILAGAAALYYLYNQHKNAQGNGPQGQYYLSKNGRVYYRDSEHRVHWVTPPSEGIQVPEEQAYQYRNFQGYNNNPNGRDLTGLVSENPEPQYQTR